MSINNIKNITLGNQPIKSIYRGKDLVYKNQVINYRLIYYLGNEFASPNKTILTTNEHWARFIVLLSI